MNITREEVGTLNEVIKINLSPADYNPQFEAELKKFQKTMNLPGFRPGHVPVGLVKKRYGKALLIEELNKIISGSLENFITESKLDLLGSPIPQPSNDSINNWDEPGEFEFKFEIGLAPQFDITLPPVKTFDYYDIEVDEAKVDQYVEDIRRKYGKFSNPEVSDENSIFYGDFAELDNEGVLREGGLTSRSTLSVASVKDPAVKQQLTGLKKGDVVVMNLLKAFNGDQDEIGHMLNQPVEKIAQITSDFQYTIDTINHVEGADMNQEFFDKIYGEGTVTSEADFKEKVRAEIKGMYTQESDVKLKHDLEDHLLQELDLKLPDSFLQKWLQTAVEKPLTGEQVEKDYPGYARGMKMRLIENKIFRAQNMQISKEEINEMARQYILHQFSGYAAGLNEEIMESLIKRYLEKRESVERIIETLSDRKVFNYLKSIVKTNHKPVKYDEFVNIVKNHHHH
ncbi:MAG: trigger factor [Bacteroidota bacterium]|nr:trigger factor [Bacteroidota bacterium]